VKSRADPSFWKLYRRLPRQVRQSAVKAYRLWRENPHHPSLRFKRVDPEEPLYSVRISLDYRAVGWLEQDTIIWFWIGDHDDYDRLLG
jgi:hypothetical protein